jgi:hypothetical protein
MERILLPLLFSLVKLLVPRFVNALLLQKKKKKRKKKKEKSPVLFISIKNNNKKTQNTKQNKTHVLFF